MNGTSGTSGTSGRNHVGRVKHDDDLHTLTGAYALDALTREERDAFAAHLGRCAPCAEEVAEFAATATRLAAAVSLAPPARMRESVLHRVDSVRQFAPPTRPGRPAAAAFGSVLRRSTGPFVVAACIAAAAAFGGLAARQYQQADAARTRAQEASRQVQDLAAVMAAPDARVAHGRTSTGAGAAVVTSPRLNKAVFTAAGLPPAPAGKTYQLWFDDRGTMLPAGLLARDGAVLMEGDPGRARAVGLTLEPGGGSPQPTTTPLLLLDLPA
ncbi:anti-sigma factor [Streptomyces sp. NPDC055254]